MTTEDIGLFLDYSKNRITGQTLKLLIQLANQAGLKNRIEAMFSGEKINVTEGPGSIARCPARSQRIKDHGRWEKCSPAGS